VRGVECLTRSREGREERRGRDDSNASAPSREAFVHAPPGVAARIQEGVSTPPREDACPVPLRVFASSREPKKMWGRECLTRSREEREERRGRDDSNASAPLRELAFHAPPGVAARIQEGVSTPPREDACPVPLRVFA
jgi:hypothetical protein